MREVEGNMKVAMAILAVSLGRIKKEALFRDVAPDFKTYLMKERTSLSYQKAVHLAAIGENFWKFRTQLQQNEIKLSTVMSKVRLLEYNVVESDPMIWDRLKSLSYREFKTYINRQKDIGINVYSDDDQSVKKNEHVIAKGASLYLGVHKLRGLNLNEARLKLKQGKRLVAIWVDDDLQARRVRKIASQMD